MIHRKNDFLSFDSVKNSRQLEYSRRAIKKKKKKGLNPRRVIFLPCSKNACAHSSRRTKRNYDGLSVHEVTGRIGTPKLYSTSETLTDLRKLRYRFDMEINPGRAFSRSLNCRLLIRSSREFRKQIYGIAKLAARHIRRVESCHKTSLRTILTFSAGNPPTIIFAASAIFYSRYVSLLPRCLRELKRNLLLYENVIVDPRIIYVRAKRSSLDGAIFPLSQADAGCIP